MKTLQELLDLRFGDIGAVPETLAGNEAIRHLAGRGVVRRFKPEPLPVGVLDTLAAVALSSPSKSDLQQRDILIVAIAPPFAAAFLTGASSCSSQGLPVSDVRRTGMTAKRGESDGTLRNAYLHALRRQNG